MRGFVYFIAELPDNEADKMLPEYGPVKVGWSRHPDERLAELQCGNPRKLVLLTQAPGFKWEERWAHLKLARYRIRGEWFLIPYPTALAVAVSLRSSVPHVVDAGIDGLEHWQPPVAA